MSISHIVICSGRRCRIGNYILFSILELVIWTSLALSASQNQSSTLGARWSQLTFSSLIFSRCEAFVGGTPLCASASLRGNDSEVRQWGTSKTVPCGALKPSLCSPWASGSQTSTCIMITPEAIKKSVCPGPIQAHWSRLWADLVRNPPSFVNGVGHLKDLWFGEPL